MPEGQPSIQSDWWRRGCGTTAGSIHSQVNAGTTGHAFIIHQPNAPSGGRLSHIELGEFLRSGNGPEQQALLRLIGTLVDVPPYAERLQK
jgi:hypothetical protein